MLYNTIRKVERGTQARAGSTGNSFGTHRQARYLGEPADHLQTIKPTTKGETKMTNIRTYFNRLYDVCVNEADWEAITDYEQEVFEMDVEDLHYWATENEVDLTAVDENTGETYLQLWAWDMDEE
jgi:hypothetical protein